jgi:hypothetical protein
MIATYFPQISQISAENSRIFPADLADHRRKQPCDGMSFQNVFPQISQISAENSRIFSAYFG